MPDSVNIEDMIRIIEGIVKGIDRNVEYLTNLDQAIGDGDHGITLRNGFKVILDRIGELKGKDAGQILETVGNILISSLGGAAGPLYGVAFVRAGSVVKGKHEVGLNDLANMLEAAEKGIVEIGGAALGEKTMLDAIHPAALAMRKSGEENTSLTEGFERCVKAAEQGLNSTVDMVAKRGRASYLGLRSKGHPDVGAASVLVILKSALSELTKLKRRDID
jgi:dihydroxyacetone kinase-like protein